MYPEKVRRPIARAPDSRTRGFHMLPTRPRVVLVRSPQHFVDFDHPDEHPLLAAPGGGAPQPNSKLKARRLTSHLSRYIVPVLTPALIYLVVRLFPRPGGQGGARYDPRQPRRRRAVAALPAAGAGPRRRGQDLDDRRDERQGLCQGVSPRREPLEPQALRLRFTGAGPSSPRTVAPPPWARRCKCASSSGATSPSVPPATRRCASTLLARRVSSARSRLISP